MKFEKGDWVKVYGGSVSGKCWSNGSTFCVINRSKTPQGGEEIELHDINSHHTYTFHPKQCRMHEKREVVTISKSQMRKVFQAMPIGLPIIQWETFWTQVKSEVARTP